MMKGYSSRSMGESASSWLCGLVLLGLILVASLSRDDDHQHGMSSSMRDHHHDDDDVGERYNNNKQLNLLHNHRPCEEIYVVGEGETLHTISDKCGDPFIVERNPHIHDPDDVFPGLVIKINPSNL